MKQKLLIGAVLTACLALLACGSLAYRTVSGTATNVITAGNVGIALNDLTQDPETGKKVETEWANTICENFYDGAFPVKFRYAMSHVSFPRWGAADYTMATREEKYVASSCLWAQASNALEYPAAINLTTDAQKAVAEIDNISNYINEMTYKFITGAEPLTNFDTYMDTLQKMGIENLIQLHQEAYDSFMSRGK